MGARVAGTPRVGVGLPVFNGERYVAEAIESILSQTEADLELVVSDNGSTDGTERICRAFARRDHRVRYERSPVNLGAAWNFNRVFRLSSGECFKWMAHDDVCAPDFLRRCLEVLDADPAAVVAYPRAARIDEAGNRGRPHDSSLKATSDRPAERFRRVIRMPSWCLPIFGVIRRSALERTGLIRPFPGADHVLLAELSLQGRLREVPEELFLHREHPERYVRRYPGWRTALAWWDPRAPDGLAFVKWRWLRAHLGSIARSPLPAAERWRCYGEMARWSAANIRSLVGDVLRVAGGVMGGR